jgi:hypothetical protein
MCSVWGRKRRRSTPVLTVTLDVDRTDLVLRQDYFAIWTPLTSVPVLPVEYEDQRPNEFSIQFRNRRDRRRAFRKARASLGMPLCHLENGNVVAILGVKMEDISQA